MKRHIFRLEINWFIASLFLPNRFHLASSWLSFLFENFHLQPIWLFIIQFCFLYSVESILKFWSIFLVKYLNLDEIYSAIQFLFKVIRIKTELN